MAVRQDPTGGAVGEPKDSACLFFFKIFEILHVPAHGFEFFQCLVTLFRISSKKIHASAPKMLPDDGIK